MWILNIRNEALNVGWEVVKKAGELFGFATFMVHYF